jgi:cold shock protein
VTMTSKVTGTRKVWRGEFGYILADDGNDVFLHYRECERCGIQTPNAGDKLEFEIERGPKGLRAVRVAYV